MNVAAIVEKGQTTWTTIRTRMAMLPPWMGPLILVSLALLIIWIAVRRAGNTPSKAGSWLSNARLSMGSMVGAETPTRPPTASTRRTTTRSNFDPDYHEVIDGEVFWRFDSFAPRSDVRGDIDLMMDDLARREMMARKDKPDG